MSAERYRWLPRARCTARDARSRACFEVAALASRSNAVSNTVVRANAMLKLPIIINPSLLRYDTIQKLQMDEAENWQGQHYLNLHDRFFCPKLMGTLKLRVTST